MRHNPRFLLCGLTLVAIATGRIVYQLGPYLAGRRGHDAISQQYEFTWMLLVGLFLGISVLSTLGLGVLLLSRVARVQTERKKNMREALALFAITATTWAVCFATSQPTYQYFLTGFKEFASEQKSLPEIRLWSSGLNIQEGLVSEKEWPQFVSALGPSSVLVENNGGKREVSLNWGGGFFHWGLTLQDTPGLPPDRSGQEIQVIDALTYVWADSK